MGPVHTHQNPLDPLVHPNAGVLPGRPPYRCLEKRAWHVLWQRRFRSHFARPDVWGCPSGPWYQLSRWHLSRSPLNRVLVRCHSSRSLIALTASMCSICTMRMIALLSKLTASASRRCRANPRYRLAPVTRFFSKWPLKPTILSTAGRAHDSTILQRQRPEPTTTDTAPAGVRVWNGRTRKN